MFPVLPIISQIASKGLAFSSLHWKEIILGLMIGTIGYQNFWPGWEVFSFVGLRTKAGYQREIAVHLDNLNKCIEGNKVLEQTINKRNAEVQSWKDVSDKLEDEFQGLKGKLDSFRKETNNKVTSILNAPTPKSCEEAIEHLRAVREQLKWKDTSN